MRFALAGSPASYRASLNLVAARLRYDLCVLCGSRIFLLFPCFSVFSVDPLSYYSSWFLSLIAARLRYAIMDKAYDCDKLIEQLKSQGIIPVIPPKANRKEPREYDKCIYKKRHLVECFIGKLKQFRRVFSRFEKWAKNYMNFVRFASALICLRRNVNTA